MPTLVELCGRRSWAPCYTREHCSLAPVLVEPGELGREEIASVSVLQAILQANKRQAGEGEGSGLVRIYGWCRQQKNWANNSRPSNFGFFHWHGSHGLLDRFHRSKGMYRPAWTYQINRKQSQAHAHAGGPPGGA